jgi:hypothetical protein
MLNGLVWIFVLSGGSAFGKPPQETEFQYCKSADDKQRAVVSVQDGSVEIYSLWEFTSVWVSPCVGGVCPKPVYKNGKRIPAKKIQHTYWVSRISGATLEDEGLEGISGVIFKPSKGLSTFPNPEADDETSLTPWLGYTRYSLDLPTPQSLKLVLEKGKKTQAYSFSCAPISRDQLKNKLVREQVTQQDEEGNTLIGYNGKPATIWMSSLKLAP